MAVKNQAASALARLKNQAKTEGINYQMCLQLFFQEEFLRRLSHSKYRDNLVLKGGMFIYTLTAFDSRPTNYTGKEISRREDKIYGTHQ